MHKKHIGSKGFPAGNSHFVDGKSKEQKFLLRRFVHKLTFSFNVYNVHERNKKIVVYLIGKKNLLMLRLKRGHQELHQKLNEIRYDWKPQICFSV